MYFIIRVIQIFLLHLHKNIVSFYLYHTRLNQIYYLIIIGKKLIRIFYDRSFSLSMFEKKKINKFQASIDPYQKKESILLLVNWINSVISMFILKMNPNSLLFPRISKLRRMSFLLKKLRCKVRYCLTLK